MVMMIGCPDSGPTASSTTMANVGTARPTLELIAKLPPRPMCPSQMAIGSAIAAQMTSATNDTSTCSYSRARMPLGRSSSQDR